MLVYILLQAGLPPGELRRAVYPLLASFSSPEAQAFPRHSLSEAALSTSGAAIYLLDRCAFLPGVSLTALVHP